MISTALSIDPLNQRLPANIIDPDVRMSIRVENCPHQRLNLIPFVSTIVFIRPYNIYIGIIQQKSTRNGEKN